MRPIGCPETSVTNYLSMLRKIPEKRRAQLYRGGGPQSSTENFPCDKTLHYSNTLTLLTPWRRVLLENLMAPQPVKTLPTFHGIRMFINLSTISCHLFLSWTRPFPIFAPSSNFLKVHFSIISQFGVHYSTSSHVTSLVYACVFDASKVGR